MGQWEAHVTVGEYLPVPPTAPPRLPSLRALSRHSSGTPIWRHSCRKQRANNSDDCTVHRCCGGASGSSGGGDRVGSDVIGNSREEAGGNDDAHVQTPRTLGICCSTCGTRGSVGLQRSSSRTEGLHRHRQHAERVRSHPTHRVCQVVVSRAQLDTLAGCELRLLRVGRCQLRSHVTVPASSPP